MAELRVRLFAGLRRMTPAAALRNAAAGLTLASMNIPQVLGYTRIAGTPPISGLYTVLLPLVGFAAFGSSAHLVVAADSATAAIFSGSLSGMAAPASPHYMALVSMVALLTAGLLLMARIFKLGFLADFLSRTVLVGFLAGVGVQVAIVMAGDMLNLSASAHSSLVQAIQLARMLPQASLPSALLSLLVVAAILLGKRFAPHVPVPLITVVGTIAASAAFDLRAHGIAVIGAVPGGLPALGLPDVTWRETLALLPVAASCFVMIIAQSAATARAFAARHGEAVDADADILGLAAANAAAALSGTFVVNGSPTQTAMADRAGGTSQLAQLVFAGLVLVVLLFLTGPLHYLPRCVLGAIVLTIAIGMIDVRSLHEIRRESPGEFMLALVTAATVVAVGVEQAILLATALSLFRHVRHSYRPYTAVLTPRAAGAWTATPVASGMQTEPGLVVYRFGADLFYANYTRFTQDLSVLAGEAATPVRWIVVEAGAIINIDFTAAHAVRDLIRQLAARHVAVAFGRVAPSLRADMDRHGVTAAVGEAHVFTTLHEALQAARQALALPPADGGERPA
ncbi:MAG: SulP family inorganic anion transporter [Rhodospirillales bacterium]|nr:SulP family inorganic anion transporter [Rhodospirillales bacterium]